MKKHKWILAGIATAIFAVAVALALCLWNGVILCNNPSRERYPVRGVDVSSYQGQIDWQVLAEQGIDFAFIKATEGSGYQDPNFFDNYAQAQKTELRIGAYHFFSFESGGMTQAENFIRTVQPCENMLPPVVDLEYYGDFEASPPDKEAVCRELDVLLARLEACYGMKPILYATEASYDRYLAGGYAQYDIWIRDVFKTPQLSDGRSWTFWQYTNRETLPGYSGQERFIDMNVFYGTKEQFTDYGK